MKILSLDIETIPQPNLVVPPIDEAEIKAGNIKDPKLIAEKIARVKEEHALKFMGESALYADTAQIVFGSTYNGQGWTLFGAVEQTEREIVQRIINNITTALDGRVPVIGYNLRGFDLPVILFRAMANGITLPANLLTNFKGRMYWNELLVDLIEHPALAQVRSKKLSNVLAALGLPAKSGEGMDFPALWVTDRAGAMEYNKQDSKVEWLLAQRLGL